MSLFECKMCGGALEFSEGASVAKCKYCGTTQTLPKTMDENLQNLFIRANTLRIKSEFDKAEKIYERIIQADTTLSEAYWGLILCKYGIEYVDDPETHVKVPTCHLTSYDSIVADDDFKSALEYADEHQRAVLEEQAREIDRIQKEILALAQKEETYDVFICYKETGADGKRTRDSVIANDIYYQLKQEGFKVFYAAITLENKLGSAYEPIIFAALNSAKVMLAVGTKSEHFNAVWVKNEWSRYLKIIKKDRSKLLIPCYRDMDAYELPDEFAHLQAQDMAKIGFINDLVRGIKKVVKQNTAKPIAPIKESAPTAAPAATTPANIAPLIKRAFLFLEDGEWEHANEYLERVLDVDPENANAYVGKLLFDLHVRKQDDLAALSEPFDNNNYYQKAIRFAAPALKTTLTKYIDKINERKENDRLEGLYLQACALKENARDETACRAAAEAFRPIQHYKDSAQLLKECLETAEDTQKIAILAEAQEKIDRNSISDYTAAITLLQTIDGCREADSLIAKCRESIETLRQEAEAKRLEQERLDEIHRQKIAARSKRVKKVALIATPIVCFAVIIAVLLNTVDIKTLLHDHSFGDWEIVVAASCTTNGSQERTCSCGEKETQPIAATGHTVVKDLAKEPTLTSPGLTEGSHCSVCSQVFIAQEEISLLLSPEGLVYTVQNNEIAITGIGTYTEPDLQIPAHIHDMPVTRIEKSAFKNCTGLTNVSIPVGITSIGSSAFEGCSSLTSVSLPVGITSIEKYAFSGCSSLTDVSIPKGVTSISGYVFSGCSSLTSVSIPEGVTSIAAYAFSDCSSLTSISIPQGATSIGDYSFSGCSSLTDISLPVGLMSITNFAFSGCSSLTGISIPAGVTMIGVSAFKDCTGLTSVSIPVGVTMIGNSAFKNCSSLTSVSIPVGVTSIEDSAFYDCSSLTSVSIPRGVIRIGSAAFRGCSNLESVSIPVGITTIEDSTFAFCSNMESISIPVSVTNIKTKAFHGCGNLKGITYGGTAILWKLVKTEDNNLPFMNAAILYTDDDTTQQVGSKGLAYSVQNNCVIITGIGTCIDTEIIIPDKMIGLPVTSIGDAAFQNCSNLTSISIPEGVISIGSSAFKNCSNLTSVSIPEGITSIKDSTFKNCSSLTSVSIPEGVITIGLYAFSDCGSLTGISIPAGVSNIEAQAFYNCANLTSISLPVEIKKIGQHAFVACYTLKNVTYGGTLKQWKNIPIDSYSPLKTATIHCTDGDLTQ